MKIAFDQGLAHNHSLNLITTSALRATISCLNKAYKSKNYVVLLSYYNSMNIFRKIT